MALFPLGNEYTARHVVMELCKINSDSTKSEARINWFTNGVMDESCGEEEERRERN